MSAYKAPYPFWFDHPSVRNRSPSATILDIYKTMAPDLLERVLEDAEHHRSKGFASPLCADGGDPMIRGFDSEVVDCKHTLPDGTLPITPPRVRAQNAQTEPTWVTPIKNSLLCSVKDENKVVLKLLEKQLADVLEPHLHRGLPVMDFVKLVYKFSPEEIPKKTYRLQSHHCRKFCHVKGEPASYQSLQAILGDLQDQLHRNTKARPLDSSLYYLQEKPPKSNYAEYKPDFFFSTNPPKKVWHRQHWNTALAYGEVKRSSTMHQKVQYVDHDIDLGKLLSESAQSVRARPSPQRPQAKEPVLTRRLSQRILNKKAGSTTNSPEAGPSNATSKDQKRKSLSTPLNLPGRPRKKSRSDDVSGAASNNGIKSSANRETLSGDEKQSAVYLNELMSHGARSFCTGWLLEDTIMSLWYIDRMGAVQSANFDIFKESHYLLLVVAAMSSARLEDLGICPLMKSNSRNLESWSGTTLEMDEADANADAGTLSGLKFAFDDTRRMYTDYGAVGRGTTIIPIRPMEETARHLDIGEDQELVAKSAWPPERRTAEAAFVRKVRTHLRASNRTNMLKHIVDIKCSLTRTMQETQLPRAFMELEDSAGFEKRVFRAIVMPLYEKLEMINSVDEFKTVFIDVVRAHHWVYETSGILHRDISVGNVMFYRHEGKVTGVLCDWDLAYDTHNPPDEKKQFIEQPDEDSDVVMNTNASAPAPRGSGVDNTHIHKAGSNSQAEGNEHPRPRVYRTGTGPFMAYQLLTKGEVPPHIYRFDLESFFWLLTWFCAVFNPKTHKCEGHTCWESPNLYKIGQEKRDFLDNYAAYESAFEHADDEYRGLVDTWVLGLSEYFGSVLEHQTKVNRVAKKIGIARQRRDGQAESRGRTELEDVRRAGDTIVTYEGFMRTLRVKKEEW